MALECTFMFDFTVQCTIFIHSILDILAAKCKYTHCTTLLHPALWHWETPMRRISDVFVLFEAHLTWVEFSWGWAQVRGAASAVSTVCSRAPSVHPVRVPAVHPVRVHEHLGTRCAPSTGTRASAVKYPPGFPVQWNALQDPDGCDCWPSRLNLWNSLLYLKVYAS